MSLAMYASPPLADCAFTDTYFKVHSTQDLKNYTLVNCSCHDCVSPNLWHTFSFTFVKTSN